MEFAAGGPAAALAASLLAGSKQERTSYRPSLVISREPPLRARNPLLIPGANSFSVRLAPAVVTRLDDGSSGVEATAISHANVRLTRRSSRPTAAYLRPSRTFTDFARFTCDETARMSHEPQPERDGQRGTPSATARFHTWRCVRRLAPAHPLSQSRDVRRVMLGVPRVEGQHPIQFQHTQLWMP